MNGRLRKTASLVVTLVIIGTGLVLLYDDITRAYVSQFDVRPTHDVKILRGLAPWSQNKAAGNPPNNTFISHTFSGRLGNVLFQYASLYCIAKRNNMIPLFSSPREIMFLKNPGKLVSYSVYWPKVEPKFYRYARYCCSYDERLEILSNDRNYSIQGYLQSWRYFEPCKEEILDIVIFKDKYVEQAEDILTDLRRQLPKMTLVGVHIRMEDHTSARASRNGKQIAPPGYFLRAMTHFRRQVRDVRFVVITSSQEWWLSNVTRSDDVVFLNRSHPAVDMEVLSRLDHIIISVGTFGWWAAYRNTGTVVVFNDFYRPGSHFGNQFLRNATDHIYPGWIRM